jgi:hypothetical protein
VIKLYTTNDRSPLNTADDLIDGLGFYAAFFEADDRVLYAKRERAARYWRKVREIVSDAWNDAEGQEIE